MIKINPVEMQLFGAYIHSISGIWLDESKAYLIENRLSGLLQETDSSSFSEFYYKAKKDPLHGINRKIIDAITTGETLFFRDAAPFELLQHKLIPDVIDRHTQYLPRGTTIPIRILCAACSTGQEVYSAAIQVKEMLKDNPLYRVQILGVDISNKAIDKASRGLYSGHEVSRGLPKDKLNSYFVSEGEDWRIKDEIRAMVTFETANILENFMNGNKFDIIFCRNVSIYFKASEKIKLFKHLAALLEKEGALIIGASETLIGVSEDFAARRHLKTVYYQLK